jgi:hypothetical protein
MLDASAALRLAGSWGGMVVTVRLCCTLLYSTVLESQGSRYSANLCAQPRPFEGLLAAFSCARSGVPNSDVWLLCFLSRKGCASRGRRGLKHPTRGSLSCNIRKKDTSPVTELRFPKRVLLGRARLTISAQLFFFCFFFCLFALLQLAGCRLGAVPFSRARNDRKSPNGLLRGIISLIAGREIHRHTRA